MGPGRLALQQPSKPESGVLPIHASLFGHAGGDAKEMWLGQMEVWSPEVSWNLRSQVCERYLPLEAVPPGVVSSAMLCLSQHDAGGDP